MLLFSSVTYILQNENHDAFERRKKWLGSGILITNISLVIFWASLLGSGLVKIAGQLNNKGFYIIMQECQPWFRVFAYSGIFIFIGIGILIISSIFLIKKSES
jgi:nitric oxide reductase subunit B